MRSAKVAVMPLREVLVRMPGDTANAKDDACVLHRIVWIEQQTTHGANVRLLGKLE